MARKNDQIIVEGIEFLANRGHNLLVVSPWKIGASNTAIKEGITTENTVRLAEQADPTGSMSGGVQDLQRKGAEGDAITLVEQDIWFAFDQWCGASIHTCRTLVSVHGNISRVNHQRDRIDLAHGIDGTDVIDMSMRVDDIFRNEFQLLDRLQNTFCLIARINDDRLTRLRAGIEIAIFLKIAHRHASNNRHLISVNVLVGHWERSSWPWRTINTETHYNIVGRPDQ